MSKSSKRAQTPPATEPRRKPFVWIALATLGVALIALTVWPGDPGEPVTPAQAAATPADAEAAVPPRAEPLPVPVEVVVPKPHRGKEFPPLRFPGYPLGRSPELITAAYRFAAEHPEILTYVPCFCGCERSGHRGNADCFVKARAANGDVVAWEEHGMECNVCLDVAQQAMQMYASGASVRDIRAAVERKWAAQALSHTPTPHPPASQ